MGGGGVAVGLPPVGAPPLAPHPGPAAGAMTPDAAGRVRMFRDFDPVDPGADVPDPYYGGDSGFEEVLAMVERTASSLVETLRRERPWDGGAAG